MSEKLDRMKDQKEKAEQKLRSGVPFTTLISSQGKLHFPCAAPQLSFCSSRPGPKRTSLHPWAERTTEYDSKPFVKSNPDGRFLFWR